MSVKTIGLSVTEAAELLGISRDQIRHLIIEGELPASNIGRGNQRARFLIRHADLEAFLDRRRVKPTAKANRQPRTAPTRQWV